MTFDPDWQVELLAVAQWEAEILFLHAAEGPWGWMLQTNPYVPPSRLAIVGHAMGAAGQGLPCLARAVRVLAVRSGEEEAGTSNVHGKMTARGDSQGHKGKPVETLTHSRNTHYKHHFSRP